MPITRNGFEVRSRTGTVVFMHSETPSNAPPLSSSPSETRKEKRKCRRVPVDFSCLCSAEGPEWSGTAVNLSREGCAIRIARPVHQGDDLDRKSTRLNSSHLVISYAVFCLNKKR